MECKIDTPANFTKSLQIHLRNLTPSKKLQRKLGGKLKYFLFENGTNKDKNMKILLLSA